MKKIKKYLQTVSFICLFILTMTSTTFASSAINVVSPDEAAELAVFYYCLNASDNELIEIDSYAITPLYDEDGNVTYYSVDFFEEGQGAGYAIIGGNLNYFQCPEFSPEGNSSYYQNSLEGKETVYYNPFDIYTTSLNEEGYTNLFNQDVAEEDISGAVYGGNLSKNRSLLYTVSGTVYPEEGRESFLEDPVVYLQNLGFTNVYCTTYGTIESKMNAAGAFNYMYDIPENPGYKDVTDTFRLYNSGHCAITALSNILMYYRSEEGLTQYPATYDKMFETVCETAIDLGYFENVWDGDGVYHGNVMSIMNNLSLRYMNNIETVSALEADWDFLTRYINAQMPIYLRFGHPIPMNPADEFVYSYHATVAFGYTVMRGVLDGNTHSYKFVKLFDGWDSYSGTASTGKRYVCWDALTSSTLNLEIQNGNVIDHSIEVCMYVFMVSKVGEV